MGIELRVLEILKRDWAPIGVGDDPNAQDEYVQYASELVSLIANHPTHAEVIEYLEKAEDYIGISTSREVRQSLATKLSEMLLLEQDLDNEAWLLDECDPILEKRSRGQTLDSFEILVYCIWVADSSLRNAGDLKMADSLFASWCKDGKKLASEFHLKETASFFTHSHPSLGIEYVSLFARICDELRKKKSSAPKT